MVGGCHENVTQSQSAFLLTQLLVTSGPLIHPSIITAQCSRVGWGPGDFAQGGVTSAA